MRRIVVYLICSLLIIIFSSCSQSDNEANGSVVSTNLPTSPIQVQTLQSMETPVSVFEYTGQVFDGRLLFSIEDIENECYDSKMPIKIKLVFSNLTDKPINVLNQFSIAVNSRGDGGNVIPFIKSSGGNDLFTLADFQLVDIFSTPSNEYITIPANRAIDKIVYFNFPNFANQDISNETINIMTPSPGNYSIRFVYIEHQRELDTWFGALGSNTINICIL